MSIPLTLVVGIGSSFSTAWLRLCWDVVSLEPLGAGHVAGSAVVGPELGERRQLVRAAFDGDGAARAETAARRRVDGAGDLAATGAVVRRRAGSG